MWAHLVQLAQDLGVVSVPENGDSFQVSRSVDAVGDGGVLGDSEDAILALGDLDPHALPRQRVDATGLDLDLVRGHEHGRKREEEVALQWIALLFLEENPGNNYV